MVELDKVIAGLQNCSYPSENCYYSDCPYRGKRDADKVCLDFLIEDALNLLNDLRYDNQRLREMWADTTKKLSILRAELAEERELSARWLRESEPVVHAHWEYDDCFKCSACHTEAISHDLDGMTRGHYLTKRCPECGAHMDENLEIRTAYCPICDKHFPVRSNDSSGSCPDCGHHVVLHRVEVAE